ncbi:MAG: type II secretion system protein M [Nitrospira sp.]|nr:type II secretion system protein M [Nitrospira sp.]
MNQHLQQRWHQLSHRERILVLAGGVIVGMSLLFVLVVDPLLDSYDQLNRQEARKRKDLREFMVLAQEYTAKQAQLVQAEQRLPEAGGQFSLLAFLEEAAGAAKMRDHIAGMQPQVQPSSNGYEETAVDLRLENVSLPQVLDLLVAIDQAPYDLQVQHLKIRPKFDDPTRLETTIRVLSYAKSR